MQKPTYEELLDLLDDVSASAETMLGQSSSQMTDADRAGRLAVVDRAREVCDTLLRPEQTAE